MNDLISRKKAYEVLTEYYHHRHISQHIALREALDRVPDAESEIITCIDCIHYTPLGKDKTWGRCSVHSSPTENQRVCQSCDFCAWAERKVNND